MPACLNLNSIVAEDIDRSPKSEEEKRHTFFSTWKQVKGSIATYKALIIALLEVDCAEDAESVCKLVPQVPFAEASSLGIAVAAAASAPLSENLNEIAAAPTAGQ